MTIPRAFWASSMPTADQRRYCQEVPRQLMRAMMGEEPTGIAAEVIAAAPPLSDADPYGIRLVLPLRSMIPDAVRALTTSNAPTTTTAEGYSDILRAATVTGRAGATILTGLQGAKVAIPRLLSSGASAWRAENPGSDQSDTDSTLEPLVLEPKLNQRTTAISHQLAMQSAFDTEAMIRSDLAATLALAMEAAALHGGGTNEPVGLLANTNIASVALGTHGGTISYAAACDLELGASAGAAARRLAFVTNGAQQRKARGVQGFASAEPLFRGAGEGGDGTVLERPCFITSAIPANLTKGTSTTICSGWVFGDWSQLVIGLWGDTVDVVVDPFSKKKQGLIELTAYLQGDTAPRQPGAFSKIVDAL